MSRTPGDLIVKDPSSVQPEGIDWSAFLENLAPGTQIATSTWAVAGPDTALTVGNDSIVTGGQRAQMFLSGGTEGGLYTVTNHIVTNGSPSTVDERSFQVLIEQR